MLERDLNDSAVYLTIDDEWIDLHSAVVNGYIFQYVNLPVSTSISNTHMWVPNGQEKFGGS